MNLKRGDKVRILTYEELMNRGIPVEFQDDEYPKVQGHHIIPYKEKLMGKICKYMGAGYHEVMVFYYDEKEVMHTLYFPYCMLELVEAKAVPEVLPSISFDALFLEVNTV